MANAPTYERRKVLVRNACLKVVPAGAPASGVAAVLETQASLAQTIETRLSLLVRESGAPIGVLYREVSRLAIAQADYRLEDVDRAFATAWDLFRDYDAAESAVEAARSAYLSARTRVADQGCGALSGDQAALRAKAIVLETTSRDPGTDPLRLAYREKALDLEGRIDALLNRCGGRPR